MKGNRTRVKVVKNKVAAPFKSAEFDLMYNQGISKQGEIIDMGVSEGLIEKSGTWYVYEKERIGQGRENAKAYLKAHPETMEQLEDKLRSALATEE